MMSVFIIMVATLLFCLVILARSTSEREIGGARLALNEETLRIDSPIPLSGRPEQVWMLKSGKLVVVDTERRVNGQIYDSDRVQLSAYKLLIEHSGYGRGALVADFGFIRIIGENGRARFVKVHLYSGAEIILRYKRAVYLRENRVPPKPNPMRALCAGCGHRDPCPAL